MLVSTAWPPSSFLWYFSSPFCRVMETRPIHINTSSLLESGKPGVRSCSYGPAILYAHRRWIIDGGTERTNNQERVLGSHCWVSMVWHHTEHAQFTCQQLSDSSSGVPLTSFDLIQPLAGWWSMARGCRSSFHPIKLWDLLVISGHIHFHLYMIRLAGFLAPCRAQTWVRKGNEKVERSYLSLSFSQVLGPWSSWAWRAEGYTSHLSGGKAFKTLSPKGISKEVPGLLHTSIGFFRCLGPMGQRSAALVSQVKL